MSVNNNDDDLKSQLVDASQQEDADHLQANDRSLIRKDNSESLQKQPQASLLYKLFGCCLDRSLISRQNTSNVADDDVYPTDSQPHLKFNQYPAPKSNQSQDIVYRDSMQVKTHNYNFDVSNFIVNQVFLFGKQLLLIVHIREHNHQVNYSAPERVMANHFLKQNAFDSQTYKYYQRRHIYFPSGIDQHMSVNLSSWSYLVPDSIVTHIAKKAATSSRRESIIDAASGIGQFAMAFAKHIESVIAIESDELICDCARRNAQVLRIVSRSYSQSNRLEASEGILFFSKSEFKDCSFEVTPNRSDCVFLASHLMQNFSETMLKKQRMKYFESPEYSHELIILLKKAFALAPQVILLTPKNVKIADVVDAFTEAIKDNIRYDSISLWKDKLFFNRFQSKVKRCSLQIEKHLVNGHLKYICFYFGDFRGSEMSSQEEFKFINNQLEKCSKFLVPKAKNQLSPSVSPPSGKPTPIRIHQQIFNELGKFQVLNIVLKFNASFKFQKNRYPPISESESLNPLLISLFYGYLVDHNLISLLKIQRIQLLKSSVTSSMTPSSSHMRSQEQIGSPKDSVMNRRKDGTGTHSQNQIRSSAIGFSSRTQSQVYSTDEGVVHTNSLRTQDVLDIKNSDRTLTDQSGSWTGHSVKPDKLLVMPELRTTTINFSDLRNTRQFVEDRSKTVEANSFNYKMSKEDMQHQDDFDYHSHTGSASESLSDDEQKNEQSEYSNSKINALQCKQKIFTFLPSIYFFIQKNIYKERRNVKNHQQMIIKTLFKKTKNQILIKRRQNTSIYKEINQATLLVVFNFRKHQGNLESGNDKNLYNISLEFHLVATILLKVSKVCSHRHLK